MNLLKGAVRRLSTVAVAALSIVACGGGDGPTDPTPVSVAGTWNLRTVNGVNLPYTIVQQGTYKAELTADVITATSSGSFTQSTSFRETENGVVTNSTESDAGSYTVNGSTVTFTFQSDGSTGTGTISGNTLTVAAGGFSLIYQKQ